uniref:Uncharacterized protein n=1 Tax=Strongyloides venezuelensis TaxID=75913 RepID=A0A0K0FFN0_STRVS
MGTTMSSEPSSYKYYDKSIYTSKGSSKSPYSTQFSKEYWTRSKEDKLKNSTPSDRFAYQKMTYVEGKKNKFVSAFCDQPKTSLSSSSSFSSNRIERSPSNLFTSTSKSNQYYTFS